MNNNEWPVHGRITGPLVMIGFGSIGKGMLHLLERHFEFDRSRFVVIDPNDADRALLDANGIRFVHAAVTRDGYRDLLTPLLTEGGGQGFCVNVSVDVSSRAVMELCRQVGALYIDTVAEPWAGFYLDESAGPEARTNYALREIILEAQAENPGGPTAVNCCGANPGLVSWLVKQALLNLATDAGIEGPEPKTREEWAALMQRVGVKGIHIAERDTQRSLSPKSIGTFTNTWSVEGFVAEGLQPAELGWGTHETWMPENGRRHGKGSQSAIYLLQPGADTRVRSWTPTAGAQHAFLVTHNEAITLSDYFTVRDEHGSAAYRPTCHYAYHPCDDAVLSLHEMFGKAGTPQETFHILGEDEIADGVDELGVLLYGHGKNAYWYGSTLSIEEARALVPHHNATGLQVTSAILAGMVWALENPSEGIVEVEELDFRRCLEIQTPYLGKVSGTYTDWTPLDGRPGFFPENIDKSDPWQFRNVLVG
jgi:homospermidine synthase